MNCLDERRLLDLRMGEATNADRRHVAECDACTARLAALARDLGRIGTVLRETAPPRRGARRIPMRRLAPLALAAAIALAVALQRYGRAPATPAADDDAVALADELADALTEPIDDDTALAAAPSTCVWGDSLLGVGCEEPAVMQIAWR